MTNKLQFDPEEIRKAINVLKPDNELFEVRILQGYRTYSGYFRDSESLIRELRKVDLTGANVYLTLQKIHEGCEARLQWERFLDAKKDKFPNTSDNDITSYLFIPIDLDPTRPAGISSTDQELRYAFEMAREINDYMKFNDFTDYVFAFSGNGYHLLYKCVLPVSKKEYIVGILENLDSLFSNDLCKVDTTLSNPARIIKLYGTFAQKGRHTASRPHRLSKILEVHNEN